MTDEHNPQSSTHMESLSETATNRRGVLKGLAGLTAGVVVSGQAAATNEQKKPVSIIQNWYKQYGKPASVTPQFTTERGISSMLLTLAFSDGVEKELRYRMNSQSTQPPYTYTLEIGDKEFEIKKTRQEKRATQEWMEQTLEETKADTAKFLASAHGGDN